MNDNLPTRIYGIRFLHNDIQKEGDDRILAKDVRVGPSGTLEYNRIFPCDTTVYKGFYNGEYLVEEIDPEMWEEMKNDHTDCEYNHEE